MSHTSTPPVKTTSTKAIAGAVVGGLLAFAEPIGTTLHSGQPITGVTWFDATVSALVFAGTIFGTVYSVTNRPKL